jgi:hypothetical protein
VQFPSETIQDLEREAVVPGKPTGVIGVERPLLRPELHGRDGTALIDRSIADADRWPRRICWAVAFGTCAVFWIGVVSLVAWLIR